MTKDLGRPEFAYQTREPAKVAFPSLGENGLLVPGDRYFGASRRDAGPEPRAQGQLNGDGLLGQQVRGDFAEIPDDAEPGHNLQRVVGDVNFPPEEALARGSHKVMMVVVPAFAQGEQSEQPIVA